MTIHHVLKIFMFQPYMLQMLDHMEEDDPDCCVIFTKTIKKNRQNVRYWSKSNSHWYTGTKQQGADRIIVWCSLWKK